MWDFAGNSEELLFPCSISVAVHPPHSCQWRRGMSERCAAGKWTWNFNLIFTMMSLFPIVTSQYCCDYELTVQNQNTLQYVHSVRIQITRTRIQFTRTRIQFTRTRIQFNRTRIQFTRTRIQFTRTRIQFTRTRIQFTRIRIQFTRTRIQFTRTRIQVRTRYLWYTKQDDWRGNTCVLPQVAEMYQLDTSQVYMHHLMNLGLQDKVCIPCTT